MIHYTCDRCKRVIAPTEELHYVVKIDVQPVIDPLSPDEPDEDRDHLAEVDEMLEALDLADESLMTDAELQRRFDLCPQCYRKFIVDPLGADATLNVGFSRN
jgi:hypothetical protein